MTFSLALPSSLLLMDPMCSTTTRTQSPSQPDTHDTTKKIKTKTSAIAILNCPLHSSVSSRWLHSPLSVQFWLCHIGREDCRRDLGRGGKVACLLIFSSVTRGNARHLQVKKNKKDRKNLSDRRKSNPPLSNTSFYNYSSLTLEAFGILVT